MDLLPRSHRRRFACVHLHFIGSRPGRLTESIKRNQVNVGDLDVKIEFDWGISNRTVTSARSCTVNWRHLSSAPALIARFFSPASNGARLCAQLSELGVPPDRCHAAVERVIAAMG